MSVFDSGTRIRIDCDVHVMRPWSSSRGRNTSASVTVTVSKLVLLWCQDFATRSVVFLVAVANITLH